MRHCFIYLLVCYSSTLFSQVAIGTPIPHPSAQLDITSTTLGLLPPRMTREQQMSIVDPAAGLVIYCTDCTPIGLYNNDGRTWHALINKGNAYGDMQYWNGTRWEMIPVGFPGQILKLSSLNTPDWSFRIGSRGPAGGVVFYDKGDYTNGWRYLEAAPVDQDPGGGAEWGCNGTNIPGADGTAVGTGQANTTSIVNSCSTAGIAARLCDDLVLNGFSDWFLPSKDELGKMYSLKIIISGFKSNNAYWSSTNVGALWAWGQRFNLIGDQYAFGKYDAVIFIRAARAF